MLDTFHPNRCLVPQSSGGLTPRALRRYLGSSGAVDLQPPCCLSVCFSSYYYLVGEGSICRIARRWDPTRRGGKLFLIDGGYSLIDTTFVTNAASAFAQAITATENAYGLAHMVTNGQPRTVRETLAQITNAAGLPAPTRSVPFRAAIAAGYAAEVLWKNRKDEPPLTSFLVEQLATAHWFDITRTKSLLNWDPVTSLDQGFAELAKWYSSSR
jgi:2-alkyl-3-oxoalkanoate reductase